MKYRAVLEWTLFYLAPLITFPQLFLKGFRPSPRLISLLRQGFFFTLADTTQPLERRFHARRGHSGLWSPDPG